MGRATLTQQESMSKGRKLSLIVVWIRRLLSAVSPSPKDEAAREGCDRAGERELRWQGKRAPR
jgi:hypothetical protein